jgi:ABC-type multidrug transport system fused ATPase/permease subunit
MEIPKELTLPELTKGFQETYSRLKKPELTIHMFTLDNSMPIYILIILAKFCEVACLVLVYFVVRLYNLDSDPDLTINKPKILGLAMIAVVVEILRYHLKQYAVFKAQKLGIVLTSSITHLIKTELFKKNLEVNYKMDDEDYQTLLDRHVPSFEKYPMYHLFIIEFSMHILLTTIFGFYIFLLNFFGGFILMLLGFLAITSLFSSISRVKSRDYIQQKSLRVTEVLNAIKNKLYIKARNWEIPFFNRIQKARERELDAQAQMESTMIAVGWLIWIISYISLVIIVITWVKSSADANFYYFIIYARLFVDYYFLFREILIHRRLNEQRHDCISSLESFLATREVKPITTKDDSQVKTYYSVMTQAAYFSWNDLNSIRLKKLSSTGGKDFREIVKVNPQDAIFEVDDEDDQDESEEAKEQEDIDNDQDEKKIRKVSKNSFLENSFAYTLKSEDRSHKTRYEPNQSVGHNLSNISIKVKKGTTCFIYGEAGAGKTSLLKALMGEMLLDNRFNSKVD